MCIFYQIKKKTQTILLVADKKKLIKFGNSCRNTHTR